MKNKFLNSFLKTVVFFGVIHLTVMFFLAITTSNYEYINVARIIELNEIIPGIEKGMKSFVISSFFVLAIFLLFFRKKAN